jgi:hypothetical protein
MGMGLRKVLPVGIVLGLCGWVALAAGCSSKNKPRIQPPAEAHIQKIASLYNEYRATHDKPPATIEELKAWAIKLKPQQRADLGIDDPETAFVSPRDHQLYGLANLGEMGMGPLLAYEKTGANGKHYVVSSVGSVSELTDAQLKDQLSRRR